MRTSLRIAALSLAAAAALWAAPPPATLASFLTQGYNSKRDAWQRNEPILNTSNVGQMKLLWKKKLPSTPRQMHNLFPPLLVNVGTGGNVKQIAVVAGVSDDLWGLDVSTGDVLWHNHFTSNYTPPATGRFGGQGGTLCPGGQTASPTIGPGAAPGQYTVYALGWDGRLRQINAATGKDLAPPAKFMPPNTKVYALNLANGVIYASDAQGCGGVPFSEFSYDLKTKITSVVVPEGGGMWGRNGVAVGDNGTVYMGTGDGPYQPQDGNLGNSIVAAKLNQHSQLQITGWFAPPNAIWMWHRDLDFNDSPVAIDYQNHHWLVATSKECRLWLLNRPQIGGSDHRSGVDRSTLVCNDDAQYDGEGVWGALAAAELNGAEWVYMPFWGPVSKNFHPPIENGRPTMGGVAAFTIANRNGKWAFEPQWVSQDMNMAEEAIVANGIVFAYGSGEDTHQQPVDHPWNHPAPQVQPMPSAVQSAARIEGSTHATLFALDAKTGKTLWSSGDQITSWNHYSGISEANGRVYIPTYDGYVYCFGLGQ